MADLKSKSSRRQVPLLFALSGLENEIIRKQWADAASKNGNSPDSLLFSADQREQGAYIKKIVIACIRQITNNQNMVLHHARHAAANEVFNRLFCGREQENSGAEDPQNRVKGILLSGQSGSRRTSRALALILGHAHPKTTFKNYIHCLDSYTQSFIHFEAKQFIQKR